LGGGGNAGLVNSCGRRSKSLDALDFPDARNASCDARGASRGGPCDGGAVRM
jgi:hypothetical protein